MKTETFEPSKFCPEYMMGIEDEYDEVSIVLDEDEIIELAGITAQLAAKIVQRRIGLLHERCDNQKDAIITIHDQLNKLIRATSAALKGIADYAENGNPDNPVTNDPSAEPHTLQERDGED